MPIECSALKDVLLVTWIEECDWTSRRYFERVEAEIE